MLHSRRFSQFPIPEDLLTEYGEDAFTLHALMTLNYDEYFPELAGLKPIRIEIGVHRQRVTFIWHESCCELSTTTPESDVEESIV